MMHRFEQGNAYYYINGNLELKIFEEILKGILFRKCLIWNPLVRILNVTINEVQYEGGETYAQEKNCNGVDESSACRRNL